VKPATDRNILPEMDDAEVTPSSYLSPEAAIFSRYQKAVLRYTGTVVPDTPENRATAIRCHDQGLTFQEAGILQAMSLVENNMAVPVAALKEAVDGLAPERLALMHRIWREAIALSDRGEKATDSKAMLIKVLGPVFVVVLVAWAVSVSLPGSNDLVEGSPAPTPTPKQEEPAVDRTKRVESSYQTKLVEAQKLLKRRGLYKSKVDGIYGPGTKAALEAFQAQNGLEQTGKLDNSTFDRLRHAAGM